MIARVWRGWATPANAAAYERHFREEVLPRLKTVPGFREARLLRRDGHEESELVVITIFADLGAIRAFAGDDPERAVVAPEARRLLTRFDARVAQHDVAACPASD